MRKIPRKYECPIDNIFIDLADWMCPWYYKCGFTPNLLTTVSLIAGLMSIWFLYTNQIFIALIFLWISYFYDCMDGHYARKYKMISQAGDWYDHVKDFIVTLLYLGVLFFVHGKGFLAIQDDSEHKLMVFSIVILLLISSLFCCSYHLKLQEKYHNKQKHSPTLAFLGEVNFTENINMKTMHDQLRISRFFGCGWFYLCLTLSTLVLAQR